MQQLSQEDKEKTPFEGLQVGKAEFYPIGFKIPRQPIFSQDTIRYMYLAEKIGNLEKEVAELKLWLQAAVADAIKYRTELEEQGERSKS